MNDSVILLREITRDFKLGGQTVHVLKGIDPSMGDIIRPGGLGLTLQDRMALLAFLNTLTDPSIETDTLFQNPFN